MTGAFVIVVTVCASLSGEAACRVAEVPTDMHNRSECAAEAEAEANAVLNLAILPAMRHGVHIEEVSARCAGVGA